METSLGHEFLALVDKYHEIFKGTVFAKNILKSDYEDLIFYYQEYEGTYLQP